MRHSSVTGFYLIELIVAMAILIGVVTVIARTQAQVVNHFYTVQKKLVLLTTLANQCERLHAGHYTATDMIKKIMCRHSGGTACALIERPVVNYLLYRVNRSCALPDGRHYMVSRVCGVVV